jgi:hypothetical protein
MFWEHCCVPVLSAPTRYQVIDEPVDDAELVLGILVPPCLQNDDARDREVRSPVAGKLYPINSTG